MNLLAFDTSTEACSAALYIDGEIISRYELAPRRHAEMILPMIDQVLHEAALELTDLDAMAFGRGPGAFTGVRIAAGLAQGLAYATGVPLIAVSSLAALAQSINSEDEIIVAAIDARMEEIYCGYYRSGATVRLIGNEIVTRPQEINFEYNENCYGAGSGWKTYATILKEKFAGRLRGFAADVYPEAKHMLPLAIQSYRKGELLEPGQAAPAYLRDKVTG